jgi:hypothetical protein
VGGVPAPEKKLPFEGHRGMIGAWHGRAGRRGVRERASDGATMMGRPEVKKKEVYRALIRGSRLNPIRTLKKLPILLLVAYS